MPPSAASPAVFASLSPCLSAPTAAVESRRNVIRADRGLAHQLCPRHVLPPNRNRVFPSSHRWPNFRLHSAPDLLLLPHIVYLCICIGPAADASSLTLRAQQHHEHGSRHPPHPRLRPTPAALQLPAT